MYTFKTRVNIYIDINVMHKEFAAPCRKRLLK